MCVFRLQCSIPNTFYDTNTGWPKLFTQMFGILFGSDMCDSRSTLVFDISGRCSDCVFFSVVLKKKKKKLLRNAMKM